LRADAGDVPALVEINALCSSPGRVASTVLMFVIDGLESAIEGLNLLFTGGNKGKLIVKL
jgi:NADPH-dependent curcumin reductase CurA